MITSYATEWTFIACCPQLPECPCFLAGRCGFCRTDLYSSREVVPAKEKERRKLEFHQRKVQYCTRKTKKQIFWTIAQNICSLQSYSWEAGSCFAECLRLMATASSYLRSHLRKRSRGTGKPSFASGKFLRIFERPDSRRISP